MENDLSDKALVLKRLISRWTDKNGPLKWQIINHKKWVDISKPDASFLFGLV
jgi:hypothetical protein